MPIRSNEDFEFDKGEVRYEMPEDLKEVVRRVARDAEDMELRLSEFKFIHSLKMFGVAVGGATFVLGILFILVAVFLFSNLLELKISYNLRTMASITSGVIGVIQILAGVLLIGK